MRPSILICLCFSLVISAFPQDSELLFTPDPGVRVLHAAMGGIYTDESGIFYLYTTDGPDQGLAVSEDGLNFETVNPDDYPDYRALRMPDNTFMKFMVEIQDYSAVLKSSSSYDGFQYTNNEDILFSFRENDAITKEGVYMSSFFNQLGGICLIYLAGEIDNARSIYSPPDAENTEFTDYRTNIFNDSTKGGGSFSFWDPHGILLSDGRLCVVVMTPHGPPAPPLERKGTIYTFTSTDDGETWVQDPGYRLRYDTFTEFDVYSLNDPKLVQLRDGRFRIYVAAMLKESEDNYKYSILSATFYDPDSHVVHANTNGKTTCMFNNFPNPFNPGTSIHYTLSQMCMAELTIHDLLGRKIRTLIHKEQNAGNHIIYWNGKNEAGESVPAGVYIYSLKIPGSVQARTMLMIK